MPIEFNINPYNDDFEADNGPRENNYMRILFKPGYAVQARELTQIQTAIQNQIKLFGDHIFQDGSQVLGGHLTYDNAVISLKVENQFSNTDVDVADFLNQLVTNNSGASNKKARVIAVDDTQEKKTLMIRYIRGIPFSDGEVIKVVPGDTPKATLTATNSANVGSVISINEGVFYVNGFFVHVPEQTIVLDPYSNNPTYRVGLEIDETIIDESADTTLLDPAQDSFNYQAPGADRYQFNLVLSKRTLDSVDDSSFFELLRIENGVITKQVKYPVYSEIEKTLARRTYDESGNYTVYPFRASPSDHPSDSTKFIIEVEPGKAYVKGFEFETIGTTPITVKKARTTEIVSDYDLSLEFGNYITVKNLYSGNAGIFNTTQFANLDMHIVPTANINTTSSEEYKTTLIGSAKAKSLQKNSSDKYDLFIIDQNMTSNTFVLAAANSTTITFPSSYPITPTGIYNGVSFTVTAGPGIGQTRRIVTYDDSRVATVDREFDTTPTTSSSVTLNYAIKDIESIVVKPTTYAAQVYGGQNPSSAIYPSMDVDSFSKSSEGDTFLSRSTFDRLIYPLPETAISNDFSDIDFYHRKLITGALFAGGTYNVGLSSQEEFHYGTNGTYLSPSIVDENFIVLVKDKGSSAYSNGQILSLYHDGAAYGAYRVSPTSVELRLGNQQFIADIFVNVKIENAALSGSSIVKTKTLRGNKSSISDVDFTNVSETVTGQTGTKIDSANGVVWYTNYNDINKIPGNKQSLFISDVIKINKIYDSGSSNFLPNVTNAIDITDRFLFDTGQRDNYYEHGSIILKDGKSPPTGQTAVLLTYFEHGAGAGFFSRESYSSGDIANNFVAVYSSSVVGVTSLLDAIDFRPRRADFTTAISYSGLRLPYTDLSMELNYGYYLPRIDKLVITSNKEFKILNGLPSKYPKEPADIPDAMTIYTMFIPPYTNKARDVKLKFHENRRYTMRDIGRIEKRVDRLEYYTQLSLLEQQARDETYFYEDRILEKEKYGILVEQFDGFNIADNKNPDLLCHISFNELKPYKQITPVKLEFTSNNAPYKLNSKTYSLNYTEEEMVSQNSATKAITVQPYMFGTFNGEIELRPEIDIWISETLLPARVSTDETTNNGPPNGATGAAEQAASSTQQQTAASSSQAQETASTTTAQTGETLTQNGFESTLFDTSRERETTSTSNFVDTTAAPGTIDLTSFFIPIGDLTGGMSQFSLFSADLLSTRVVANIPETPTRGRRGTGTRGNLDVTTNGRLGRN